MALVRLESNPASAGEGSGLGAQTHIVTYDDLDLAIAQCQAGGTIAGVDVSTTNLAVQTTQSASDVLAFANVTAVVASFSL
tara:strand:- start:1910 stop:2152 length:243 start_codon:yes stop_codon:yes gene_type:complete